MAISVNRASLAAQIKSIGPMLIVAAVMLLLDQLTKFFVRKTISSGETIEVIKGFFVIDYTGNTGAAFGLFSGQNRIFMIVSLIAVIFIFVYYRQLKANIWMKIALGFLLGGALGNLVDRVVFQYVTDFIRVRWWFLKLRWWPTFNLADASVCIGAVMLIIGMLKRSKIAADQ